MLCLVTFLNKVWFNCSFGDQNSVCFLTTFVYYPINLGYNYLWLAQKPLESIRKAAKGRTDSSVGSFPNSSTLNFL